MNLLKDLANVLRNQIKAQGYDVSHVQNDDHAALMLYSKVLRYTIEPLPRDIRKAAGFQCPQQHLLEIWPESGGGRVVSYTWGIKK